MNRKSLITILGLVAVIFIGTGVYSVSAKKARQAKVVTAIASESNSLTYRNEKYGYELTLPSTWKGYSATDEIAKYGTSADVNATFFGPPTHEKLFTISALSKIQWESIKDMENLTAINLGEDSQHVFVYDGKISEYGPPSDDSKKETVKNKYEKWEEEEHERILELPGIRKSFKLIKTDVTAGWKTYSSSKYNFSLKYPNGWTLGEYSHTDLAGTIISLRSPETIQLLNERKIDPGYSYNLEVSFWPNINNEYVGGGSWIGKRTYTNLADFLTDKNGFKQKIGNTIIAGQNAYEISGGGAGLYYGIMIEHNGIYELSFGTAWDKSKLGSTEKQILSTFQFSK